MDGAGTAIKLALPTNWSDTIYDVSIGTEAQAALDFIANTNNNGTIVRVCWGKAAATAEPETIPYLTLNPTLHPQARIMFMGVLDGSFNTTFQLGRFRVAGGGAVNQMVVEAVANEIIHVQFPTLSTYRWWV
jgi:hypothetical protein